MEAALSGPRPSDLMRDPGPPNERAKLQSGLAYPVVKRGMDLLVALTALLITSPLFAVVAVMIRLEDQGPVLYRPFRVGRDGRPFRMYKFRTMVANADQIGGPSTAGDDPRLTRVGSRIRRYKLDELPQLFNVLLGNMSLVGPRPEVQHYVDMYTPAEREILSVKPGITDRASITYRNEAEILRGALDPERAYMELIRPGKIALGLDYVHRQSLWLDIRLIFQTFAALLSREPVAPGEGKG